MRLEAILNPEDLTHYLGVLSDCFVQYNIKPVKKHINLIYDYIRFYKEDLLSSPEASFDFIFNDKTLLSRYGIHDLSALIQPLKYRGKFDKISLDTFSLTYGSRGKEIYFKIKLLEIESSVLKYKLDFMDTSICH
jgi:hypothetical protein